MSLEDDHDSPLSLGDVFPEPPRPVTPPSTLESYTRDSRSDLRGWSHIEISLVGSHPLWGHHLWNASRAFASFLDAHPEMFRGQCVLELGAGGGLPGIVAAKNGAQLVVLTDYPDQPLLDNLWLNVRRNISNEDIGRIYVQGYIWGKSVEPLLTLCRNATEGSRAYYDLVIMSDLIFNHSQHDALLDTCDSVLKGSVDHAHLPSLLVFYTHHRPHLSHRDMEFFEKAKLRGWVCEEVVTKKYPPMFPDDPGEEEVRSTVHGWRLTRQMHDN